MKKITLRFFEELNDFLPAARRKKSFDVDYRGRQSVKDLIESQGVPNAEIDLIIVNGESVGFGYIVQPGDFIAVYPVIESMDISGLSKLRDRPLRDVKFILDVNLGRLAKYLRMMGFDTLYRNDYEDAELVDISNAENRIILTRDIGVLKRSSVERGYWLRSDDPGQQAKEVLARFDLYDNINPLRVCMKCNGSIEKVDKEEILDKLKPKTVEYYREFYRCVRCGSIYWKGSHVKRIEKMIAEFRSGKTE